MIYNLNGEKIYAVKISDFEEAFELKDAIKLLDFFQKKQSIILGGDILNCYLEYDYSNWYYDLDESKSIEENITQSILKAKTYLTQFIARNGYNFYVVFIVGQ